MNGWVSEQANVPSVGRFAEFRQWGAGRGVRESERRTADPLVRFLERQLQRTQRCLSIC